SPDPSAAPTLARTAIHATRFKPDPWALAQRGIWLRLLLPDIPVGGDTALPPRGLVVHLSSYGGSQFEQPVIDDLLAQGWAVLRVASPNLRATRGIPDLSVDS